MEFCDVRFEAHKHGATIYVMGLLTDLAASKAEAVINQLSVGTAIVRLDLRGVHMINPRAFVRIARALSRWRDLRRGRVRIEFPARSPRRGIYSSEKPARLCARS